jgi:hypothetical protein
LRSSSPSRECSSWRSQHMTRTTWTSESDKDDVSSSCSSDSSSALFDPFRHSCSQLTTTDVRTDWTFSLLYLVPPREQFTVWYLGKTMVWYERV